MKAFLSHSSRDKGFVEEVAETLGAANVERDTRMLLPAAERRRVLKVVTDSLTARGENDTIPVSLVDATILAQLQEDGEVPSFFAAFLLPSHLVWLARRYYDQRKLPDCMRLAATALQSKNRLSKAGIIEACRYLCLAAARANDHKNFDLGITTLKHEPADNWARSNLNFLLGFEARLQGNFPSAEDFMRQAHDLSPGNFHAARELAFICMIRGDLRAAEDFARGAYRTAPDNPYVLDILLSVLIKKPAEVRMKFQTEIDLLFGVLKQVGDDEGQSFYLTRRAEYEFKCGDIAEACRLTDKAVKKTPGVLAAHILRAEIYLDRGNNVIAHEEIQTIRNLLGKERSERNTYLRPLLEIESQYYAQIGDYQAAKQIYRRHDVFTEEETKAAIKRIELEEAYKKYNH